MGDHIKTETLAHDFFKLMKSHGTEYTKHQIYEWMYENATNVAPDGCKLETGELNPETLGMLTSVYQQDLDVWLRQARATPRGRLRHGRAIRRGGRRRDDGDDARKRHGQCHGAVWRRLTGTLE